MRLLSHKRIAVFIVIFFMLALSVSPACDSRTHKFDNSRKYVGIVFNIGGKDDHSFNAAAWEGAKRAQQQLPVIIRDIEPDSSNTFEPAMRAFAEKGFDLIIGVGFSQSPIIDSVAKDYPNIQFAIVDGSSHLPNVASLVFKEEEGSYLVGMIAAYASKTGMIGFIGGMDVPLIRRFQSGFEQGAHVVRPDVLIVVNYVGITDTAWSNPGRGKEIAFSQIEKGADVIFAAAGYSGLGAFDAVEAFGKINGRAQKFVIGVDSNQNAVKPGFVLTSMVKRVDNAIYEIVQDVVEKRFESGSHVYGLEKDGVGYAIDQFNESLLTPEMLKAVEDAKQKIIRKDIKVILN